MRLFFIKIQGRAPIYPAPIPHSGRIAKWHLFCPYTAVSIIIFFMTHQSFNNLYKDEQQDIVLRYGAFLAERKEGNFRIMLYQVENFYVEAYFYKKNKKVAWFRSFDANKNLQPYLKAIDISSLVQEVLS